MRSRTSIALLLAGLLAIGVLAFGAPGLLGPLTGSPTPAGSSSAPVPGPPTANEAESRGPSAAPANPSGLPVIKESRLPLTHKGPSP